MFEQIGKIVSRMLWPAGPSSIPKAAKFDPAKHIYDDELCPCCDSFRPFLSGPTGGMSINVMCSQCGTRLNLTPFLRRVEWTHGPQASIWGDREQTKQPSAGKVAGRRYAIEKTT